MQFQDLFELDGVKVKEFLKDDVKATRDKWGSVLKDSVKPGTFTLRLTVANENLEKILFKPSAADPHDLQARFEELAAAAEDFGRCFEELDYNEDDLADGEERSIGQIEEHLQTVLKELTEMRQCLATAEKVRQKTLKA